MSSNLRKAVIQVNKSLRWFKKGGWIDARRTPESEENIIHTLEEYVEARFNRECFEIPEIKEAEDFLDGYLFKCSLLDGDETKRKFKEAHLSLINLDDIDPPPTEDLINAINRVKAYLGGDRVVFNSLKTKTIITVWKDGK